MSGYILCQVKRAKLPYYIENISTNIYSIEELCFYFYHNIYLLDSTILNEELCFWIRDQLGLKKLADNLYKHLDDDDMKVGDFILPVFKEINYLSLEEFRKLNQQIQQLAKEPEVLRQKRKGDYLMEHGKYVNAIKVYQKALRQETEDEAAVTDIRKPETVAAEKAETVQEAETTEASTETKTEEAAETESSGLRSRSIWWKIRKSVRKRRMSRRQRNRKKIHRRQMLLLCRKKNRKKWQQIRNFLTRRPSRKTVYRGNLSQHGMCLCETVSDGRSNPVL